MSIYFWSSGSGSAGLDWAPCLWPAGMVAGGYVVLDSLTLDSSALPQVALLSLHQISLRMFPWWGARKEVTQVLFQDFAHIYFAIIPLAKAGHVVKPRASAKGSTKEDNTMDTNGFKP